MPTKQTAGHHDHHRRTIFVCENPSVLAAAADELGSRCPPMVCVEGQPTLACWTVLRLLTQSGYRLHYHGDFDWGGLRIANKIYQSFGFEPWRFHAADHRTTSETHQPLRPPESIALWDNELATRIRQCGVSIEEESLIAELLSDLRSASNRYRQIDQ